MSSAKGGWGSSKSMNFDEYVQGRGYSGYIPPAVAKQLHTAWLKDGGGFTPKSVPVTNSVTGAVEPYVMTSPNSATKMGSEAPKPELWTGKDGNLYAVDAATGSATTITNKSGAPFKPSVKQSGGLQWIMGPDGKPMPSAAVEAGQAEDTASASEQGKSASQKEMGSSSAFTNVPTVMPENVYQAIGQRQKISTSPGYVSLGEVAAANQQQAPKVAPAQQPATTTTAPTNAAAALTPDDIRAAYKAGKLSEADAIRSLRALQ